jgi:hypothetical protein
VIRKILILVLLIAGGGTAQAQWREASSRNFLVYSEGKEEELRAFAEKLEKFDFVLRRIHKVQAPPSPNKLRIILVGNQRDVAALAGYPGAGIAGYYVNDARGMMMVGSRNRVQSGGGGDRGENRDLLGIDSEAVLLHEYTHHFMYQYFPPLTRPGTARDSRNSGVRPAFLRMARSRSAARPSIASAHSSPIVGFRWLQCLRPRATAT